MKAISVKQPWAYLLCAGIKDIENRTWKLPEKYKGERVLIHASRRVKNGEHGKMVYSIGGPVKPRDYNILHALTDEQKKVAAGALAEVMIDFYDPMTTQAIIGSVRFVDCVINHESIWAEKSMNNACPLCGKKITNIKPDRQWCEDCRHVLDKGINYDKPIHNWVVEEPILFDKPILNVKGKLSFWDYPSPQCDEACFYHCTKGGQQEPDCIKEKEI